MERNFFNRCLIGRGRKKNVMNPNVFFLSPPKYSPQNEKKTQCIKKIEKHTFKCTWVFVSLPVRLCFFFFFNSSNFWPSPLYSCTTSIFFFSFLFLVIKKYLPFGIILRFFWYNVLLFCFI